MQGKEKKKGCVRFAAIFVSKRNQSRHEEKVRKDAPGACWHTLNRHYKKHTVKKTWGKGSLRMGN